MTAGSTSETGSHVEDLDVFLNGDRDYVQGTQLIARAAETVSAHRLPQGLRLSSAAFRSITDRAVTLVVDPADRSASFGSVIFETDGERIEAAFFKRAEQAARRDVTPACRWSVQEVSAPLTATYLLENVGDLEALLVAMVQAVKEQHAALAPDVSQIWFTGLRRADFAVDAPLGARPLQLSIDSERLINRGDAWQSLQSVRVTDGDGAAVFSALVSFAFQSASFRADDTAKSGG